MFAVQLVTSPVYTGSEQETAVLATGGNLGREVGCCVFSFSNLIFYSPRPEKRARQIVDRAVKSDLI